MSAADVLLYGSVAITLLGLSKALFNVASFFITLNTSVRQLTHEVTRLGDRFDEHANLVLDELSEIRERVARLEGHHEH
jgi:hypothetical protein